jgi:purine-binding chemotaxis protein CheW
MTALHVVFKVGDADYVLPAEVVVQMESYSGATPIPGAAPFVAGIVQIRGKVIPVIDLRARFGLPALPLTLDSRVIVIRHQERLVGLLADSAREVLKLDSNQFGPPPEVIAQQAQGFVQSIAQAGPRLVLRVDFEKVIGHASIPKEEHHAQEA